MGKIISPLFVSFDIFQKKTPFIWRFYHICKIYKIWNLRFFKKQTPTQHSFKPTYTLKVRYINIIICKSWEYIRLFTRIIHNWDSKKEWPILKGLQKEILDFYSIYYITNMIWFYVPTLSVLRKKYFKKIQ